MSNPQVHNVRFYKPKPKAIYCMALEPQENKLCISRSDASLEIWNLSNAPFIERTIASSTENFSVEGLAWCNNRLFSVGLHGLLIEYDLYKLDVKRSNTVTGEAAFCLDINKQKTQIAVGTEQGYINLFQIEEDEVLFDKFLDKQEGRILCIKFDKSGEFIVTGSMDAIRVWSVNTRQALHKMITGRSEQNRATIVWCLAVTEDLTIISGDSRGILTVWDGKVGAQLESYQSHKADILSLCLSEDENSLYCGGIDPNIINYVRIKVKDGAWKWVRSINRKIHNHDVRALVLHGEKLYSSGVDGYLVCSYHPPKTLIKFPPVLQNPCICLGRTGRYIMLRYPKFIEIWNLGVASGKRNGNTGIYPVDKQPKKLVVIQKVVKTESGQYRKEGIISAAMSNDGKLILYSTKLGIRLLKLAVDEDKPSLLPIEILDGLDKIPCVAATFTQNNRLITAPNSGGLQVFRLDNDTPFLIQNINSQAEIKDTIMLLKTSTDGKYLIAGDSQANIAVWILKNEQYEFYCKLPKYKISPTALEIHPRLPNLVVAYSNQNIIEYDLTRRQLTKFSRILMKNLPKRWTSRFFTIRNISFDPRVDHIITLHDDENVIIIDKNKEMKEYSKIPKIDKSSSLKGKMLQPSIRFIKEYKHLVHLSWLSDDEMVAVEVNPLSFIDQLPPCQIQSTFGRK